MWGDHLKHQTRETICPAYSIHYICGNLYNNNNLQSNEPRRTISKIQNQAHIEGQTNSTEEQQQTITNTEDSPK